jgi:DNA polymerase III alpha subunit (gram-positive type)
MHIEYPHSYVVYDLETSGLDPNTDKITEVAYIEVHNNNVVEEWSTLVQWPELKLSEKITELTGITDDMLLNEGEAWRVATDKLAMKIALAPAIITHNGTVFDNLFMKAVLPNRMGMLKSLDTNSIDTAALYKGMKLGNTRLWNETQARYNSRILSERAHGLKYNLKHCCEEFGIDMTGIVQHRALGDCKLTMELYKKLI